MTDGALDERVLVLAPLGRDALLTCKLLRDDGFDAFPCATIEELCDGVRAGVGCALVTEEALGNEAMNQVRDALAQQPPWSDFPFILFSAGESHGATATLAGLLGKVAILDRPVHVRSMISAVRSSLRSRRRQYEARNAIHQRDEFLAMLGHELRNPLGAIQLAAEMLDVDEDGQVSRRPRIIIDQQCKHLARLVDDLLDVARLTSGKVALRRELVDLGAVIRRCRSVLSPQALRRKQTLTLHLGAAVSVEGDPVRLEQIILNLVTNAIKYTPEGGHIDVTLEPCDAEGQTRVRVRDDGIGIDPAIIEHIFEMFQQAPRSIARSQGGLGIGLTLVRKLVMMHGGTVSASSPGVGAGTEFVVTLPAIDLHAAPVVAAASPVAVPLAPGSVSRKIVLVDDNDDLREMLQELLEGVGHHVETERDGVRAIERIRKSQPDLAIIDIGLPGIDGYEVARRLRADDAPTPYLVALSGYGQPGDRARSLEAGFDHHLVKPVTSAKLLNLIEAVGDIERDAS